MVVLCYGGNLMQPPMNENQEPQSLATLSVIPGPEEPAPPGTPAGGGGGRPGQQTESAPHQPPEVRHMHIHGKAL